MNCQHCNGDSVVEDAFGFLPCEKCGGTGESYKVGDHVQKAAGYKWPGVVVSMFKTLSGKQRVVVECTVPEVAGALHIYSLEQLIPAKPRTRSSPQQ